MVTRRCTQRQFLLLPSPVVNGIFSYCLALAASRTSVLVHIACVMSNHYHLLVTDPKGELPEFVYTLNKYVAKCVNAHRARWENVFAAGTQTSYVRLGDDEAILDKAVYAITNPVEALLVSSSDQWPGTCLWQPGTYKARRPKLFFRDNGPLPEALKFEIVPIPLSNLQGRREVMERLGKEVKKREKELRAKAKKAEKKFMGTARVMAQKPTDSPWSKEPRRKLSPRLASRDKWRRIELLQRLKEFWENHKAALAVFVKGDHSVLFPAGTYKMRVHFGAHCAES